MNEKTPRNGRERSERPTRIVAGVTAAILVILLLFKGNLYLILAASVICAMVAYLEYDRLFSPGERSVARQFRLLALILVSILAILLGPLVAWITSWACYIAIGVCHVFISERHSDFPQAVRQVSLELLGYTYIVGLFGFIVPTSSVPELGRQYLFLLFLLVFVGDTAAYFVGSRWGKHRLAPHISPKKSVEGAGAAIVSSFLVAGGWLALSSAHERSSYFKLAVMGAAPIISGLAQLGDLFESIMKRSQSQKDSGSFLPGHGGILDRLDGLALASPLFYFYVVYVLERLSA
jgi:phosphatidate cytidylyltransferase